MPAQTVDSTPSTQFTRQHFLSEPRSFRLRSHGGRASGFRLRKRTFGFCSLVFIDSETIELHDLFIEPSQIGKGYGKRLWHHALNIGRQLGFRTLVLTADPNAESFYAHQGAVRIGEKTSSVRPERKLPIMEYCLKE
ncbi:MAG TPA: GNAT family N-acetyltransferase [Candidatus Polarisedimenticolia bacterium]|nr:GNAT family N-acetyltransferase [Candidatus Polarisedimenticolia bacterium]